MTSIQLLMCKHSPQKHLLLNLKFLIFAIAVSQTISSLKMEIEVIERLERVSASISVKREKLCSLQSKIAIGIESSLDLETKIRLAEATNKLDYEISRERALLEEYEQRNRLVLLAISRTESDTSEFNVIYSNLQIQVQETVERSESGKEEIEAHLRGINDKSDQAEERLKLATEDLLSAVYQKLDSKSSKISTRIVNMFFFKFNSLCCFCK